MLLEYFDRRLKRASKRTSYGEPSPTSMSYSSPFYYPARQEGWTLYEFPNDHASLRGHVIIALAECWFNTRALAGHNNQVRFGELI
jgi:hypothetical protein